MYVVKVQECIYRQEGKSFEKLPTDPGHIYVNKTVIGNTSCLISLESWT